MRGDIFLRLPPPTAMLLLSSLLDLAQAHALPRETVTVPFRVLHVVSWPLVPTDPPILPDELRRRAADTVCGFIGGNPDLPATCSPGSHCVLDSEHGAIGCCPNGAASCTQGVFTGCVDYNSGPQTVANPYVFTCQGSNVCYKNTFAGGYSQFGCGTASNLATSVAASASGVSGGLSITSLSVDFTASTTSLARPTSINPSTGTRAFTRSTQSTARSTTSSASTTASSSTSKTSSTTSSSSTASSSSSSSSSTRLPLPSPNATAGNANVQSGDGSGSDKTGAIIGGAISGAAVLIALSALIFYIYKRKQKNARNGPGMGGTEYISPMTGGFKPLHNNPEGYETGLAPGMTTYVTGGSPGPNQMTNTYHYPGQNPAAYAAVGAGAGAGAAFGAGAAGGYRGVQRYPSHTNADQVPLTREFDDFSRGFSDALGRIGEEEHEGDHVPEGAHGANVNGNMAGNGHHTTELADGQAAAWRGSPRPLWQQNRRQSRNLMWM